MQKTWHLLPKAPKKILDSHPETDKIVLSLLYQRGITTQKEIEKFLEPDFSNDQHDPFLFSEMEKAVKRILKAVSRQEKILIYGDYDVDGVCSSVLLYQTLNFLGYGTPEVYLPHRESEGYGLNLRAVDHIKKNKITLVITVDCGTTNVLELEELKRAKIDVIIVDHHSAPAKRPPVFAFINPKFPKENYPFRDLSAGGVVFKLTQALLMRCLNQGNQQSFSELQKESFLKWSLDLVALSTVADMMPLLDENRTFVKWGLIVLNKTKRLGLKTLFKIAGLWGEETFRPVDSFNSVPNQSKWSQRHNESRSVGRQDIISATNQQNDIQSCQERKNINTYEIGFIIAPRLNAAGRMNHANSALKLLLTQDKQKAQSLALELNRANQSRQTLTDKILEQAEKQVETQIQEKRKILVAVSPSPPLDTQEAEQKGSESWPVSIIGLVAGKISDKYYRPCFLITKTEKGDFAGSGRSIKNFDIIEAVAKCQNLLNKFGGHPGACGFSFKKEEDISVFIQEMNKIANQVLKEEDLKPKLEIAAELNFSDLQYGLLRNLRQLEPFGQNNPEPLFVSRDLKVLDLKSVGKNQKHLVLKLCNNNCIKRAIGFSLSANFHHLKIGDCIDAVYKIKENTYNGISELQMVVEDIKISR